MLSKGKLNRVNQLAKKAKSEGLTIEEKAEQKELRQIYLQNVRKSFDNQFKTMKVIDPNGVDVTPKKVKDLQRDNENI